MEIEQEFHDYCEGCPYLEIVHMGERYRTADLKLHIENSYITCKNMELCQRLLEHLSTIRPAPPDLMEQIATICRDKGISAEEAVGLFKNL